jgi:hypothetical protein
MKQICFWFSWKNSFSTAENGVVIELLDSNQLARLLNPSAGELSFSFADSRIICLKSVPNACSLEKEKVSLLVIA